MSCTPSKILICITLMALFSAIGCAPTKPMFLNDTGDLSYYIEQATKVDYPDVEYDSLDEVNQAYAPITVLDPDFSSYRDITLEDAVSFALSNTKVIRGYGTPSLQGVRIAPGQDNLENGPAAAATTYNVAIRETEPGFLGTPGQISGPGSITTNTGLDSNQGVEAALAAFDAQLTSSLNYTKSDEPRNSDPNRFNAQIFQQDQVQWQTEVAKKSANGTQIFFRNINQYTANNNPLLTDVPIPGLQALDSWYRASFEAEIRQPLLRGRGTFINRMPIVISRLGTDQEIANLDATLQNMVTNVEIRYWDLYCAYRNLDAAKTGRDAALTTWRIVKDQYDEGAEVNIQQLAQASGQYNFFQERITDAYNNVLDAEGKLRYLFGWAATDSEFLRPIDQPVMAPVEFDWCTSLCEALTYRPELRTERIEIKKKQLALAYAKNGLLPELNVSMLYRWLGLGNKYGTSEDSDRFPLQQSGALNELYGGNFQEIQIGGSFGLPIGFRRELANVRNAQLKLAREMARVEDMELDITKNLTEAMRALSANQKKMVHSFNQWKDTSIEEAHFKRLEDAGVETLDVALDAQRRRSDAEVSFYTSLCEYNKAIALIHRRKGTILPYSGVGFAEGPWPDKAYVDAQEHARRRGASRQINYGWTRPEVISRGEDWPTAQNTGQTPVAYAIPTSNDMLDGETMPLNTPSVEPNYPTPAEREMILETPEKSTMTPPGLNAPTSNPTIPTGYSRKPSADGASARPIKSGVQKVAFMQDIPPAVGAKKNLRTQTGVTPVAVLKEKYRKPSGAKTKREALPQRDASAQPSRRLRAIPDTNNKPVLRNSSISWEKFGLTRPETSSEVSTAKIKHN